MSRILIVRHGQSTWNAEGKWQGQADPPLSEDGIHQAMRAATVIEPFDLVRASDLERAHHTAQILAKPRGLEVLSDTRLRERKAGLWTGLTREGFAVDASVVAADASGQRSVPGTASVNWNDERLRTRAVREYLAALDESRMPPKSVSLSAPPSSELRPAPPSSAASCAARSTTRPGPTGWRCASPTCSTARSRTASRS